MRRNLFFVIQLAALSQDCPSHDLTIFASASDANVLQSDGGFPPRCTWNCQTRFDPGALQSDGGFPPRCAMNLLTRLALRSSG